MSFCWRNLDKDRKDPSSPGPPGGREDGVGQCQPYSKTQPICSSKGSHPTLQEELAPCLAPLPTWKNLYLRSRKTAPPDSPAGKEGTRDSVTQGRCLRNISWECRGGFLTSARIVILLHPTAQELVCHYLTDVRQAGEGVFVFGDGLDTVFPLQCGE